MWSKQKVTDRIVSCLNAILCLGILGVQMAQGATCPLIPMGAITGRPDEKQVRETLEAYKAVGIDQYLVYARSGLEYEYMGEEWLQMCEWFCKHAKQLDMKIWLYDEYNWPSGSCKNRVQADRQEFQYSEQRVHRKPDGTFMWSMAYQPQCVNVYHAEAVQRFMALTHHVYEKRLRAYLGTTVRGIFSDEPGSGGWIDAKGAVLKFRSFDGLEENYLKETGRAFRADVEAFLKDPEQDAVWGVYAELQGNCLRASFFDPIRKWADQFGMLSTGHLMDEHDLVKSTHYNGNALLALQGLSLPAMDEVFTKGLSCDPDWEYTLLHAQSGQIEWLTLGTLQHAALRRKTGGLAELFAVGPCDMSLTRHRQMIWLTALHGVDHYLLAVAPLDGRGLVEKATYYNDFTPTQPWFSCLNVLGDEAQKAAEYARMPPICDVAIRFPLHLAGRASINAKRRAPALVELLHRLSMAQLSWELYAEDEACAVPYVLSFNDDGSLVETCSGKKFKSPARAVAFLKESVPACAHVILPEGTLAHNLCVRRYANGPVVVLNLSNEARSNLCLVRPGQADVSFELPPRGVFIQDARVETKQPQKIGSSGRQPLPEETRFTLTLSNPNTVRVVFTGQVARVTVKVALDNVRMVVRQYPQPCGVDHNGTLIHTDQVCDWLPQGFRPLYAQSAPIQLEPGEHLFKLQDTCSDPLFFLPVLWLAGDLATDSEHALVARSTHLPVGSLRVSGLSNFAGKLTYTAQVTIPLQARFLRFETGDLCASVQLGQKNLGVRAWAPFVWPVPDSLKGQQAELQMTVYTSVAPIFGCAEIPGARWKKLWLPMPSQAGRTGLITQPEWCW